MKKAFMAVLLFLATLNLVSAGVGSIDTECRANGYSYGIAKYELMNNGGYELAEQNYAFYNVLVNGTGQNANWTSQRHVFGVISKEGQDTYVYKGGRNGSVNSAGKHDISHLTFCGEYAAGGDVIAPKPVPEFSLVTLVVTVIIGGLGLVMMRSRPQ